MWGDNFTLLNLLFVVLIYTRKIGNESFLPHSSAIHSPVVVLFNNNEHVKQYCTLVLKESLPGPVSYESFTQTTSAQSVSLSIREVARRVTNFIEGISSRP